MSSINLIEESSDDNTEEMDSEESSDDNTEEMDSEESSDDNTEETDSDESSEDNTEETDSEETDSEETDSDEDVRGVQFGKERDKALQEDERCYFKRPCLKELQNSLVDSTKDNTVIYSILAGITAAVGLATNSPATVIGSMLLSPIGDLIVRLSLVSNFKIHQSLGHTNNQNYSRKAFQERFLERLNIPTKKLIIRTVNNKLKLWLKSNPKNPNNVQLNNEIKQIYKYHDNLYFNLNDNDDNKIYDINGIVKFTLDANGTMKSIKDASFTIKDYNKLSMDSLRKRIEKFENQNYVPSFGCDHPKKYDIKTILWVSFWVCALAVIVGLLCGFVFYYVQEKQENPDFVIPTAEMESRAKMENAWGMFFIAGVAGFILPWAIRRKNTIRLVGINIATALLPPLVNVGLYLGIKIVKASSKKVLTPEEKIKDEENDKMLDEAWKTGLVIFAINFGLLFIISTISLYFFCEGEKSGIFKDFDLC